MRTCVPWFRLLLRALEAGGQLRHPAAAEQAAAAAAHHAAHAHLAHLLHHLPHFLELLEQPVHFRHRPPRSPRDAGAARSVEDLRPPALLRRHGQHDRLHVPDPLRIHLRPRPASSASRRGSSSACSPAGPSSGSARSPRGNPRGRTRPRRAPSFPAAPSPLRRSSAGPSRPARRCRPICRIRPAIRSASKAVRSSGRSPDADELHRHAQHAVDRQGGAAAGVAVHLRQHDAVDPDAPRGSLRRSARPPGRSSRRRRTAPRGPRSPPSAP